MKFGQLLKTQYEAVSKAQAEEFNFLFSAYKRLKKQLKCFPEHHEPHQIEEHEALFSSSLGVVLTTMNEIFIQKEENWVISVQLLEEEAAAAVNLPAIQAAYEKAVNFHGEVVLFMHWSALSYTATVKILKKHYKRTGVLLKSAQATQLLSQPFCRTEVMSYLVQQTERIIHSLHARLGTLDARAVVQPLSGSAARPPSFSLPFPPSPDSTAAPSPSHPATTDEDDDELMADDVSMDDDESDDKLLGSSPDTAGSSIHQSEGYSGLGSSSCTTTAGNLGPMHADHGGMFASGSSCAGAVQQMQQMKVALRTWEHLKNAASSPSTMVAPIIMAHPTPVHTRLSS